MAKRRGYKSRGGFFANGDNSHVANEAKALWYAIDNVQQGKRAVNHADKLAEALRDTLEQFGTFTESDAWEVSDQEQYDKASKTLAAYEAAQ